MEFIRGDISDIQDELSNLNSRISDFEKPDTGIIFTAEVKQMFGENKHSYNNQNTLEYGGDSYNVNVDTERITPLDATVLELNLRKNNFLNQKMNEKIDYIEGSYTTNINNGKEKIELNSETTIEGFDEKMQDKGSQGKNLQLQILDFSVLTEKNLFKTPFKWGLGYNYQEQKFSSSGEDTTQEFETPGMVDSTGKGTLTEIMYKINTPYVILEAEKEIKNIDTNHQLRLSPYSTIQSQYNNYYFGQRMTAEESGFGIGYSLSAKKEIKENVNFVLGLDANYKKYNNVEYEVFEKNKNYSNVEEYYEQYTFPAGEITQKDYTVGLGIEVLF